MALNITPKTTSTAATSQAVTPQTPRPSVTFNKQTPTTARAEALKARLSNQPSPSAPAPRPAGSTARAEQYAKLQSYAPQPQQKSVTYKQPMQDVAPPPVQPQNLQQNTPIEQGVSPLADSVETSETSPEAARELAEAQFAAFERQERAIRKARMEFERERAQWKAEQEAFAQKLKANPLQLLNENGITYDKLTELQLSQANPDPNQEIINKRLEEIQRNFDEKLAQRDQEAYQNAVKQIRSDVSFLVDSDPSFEITKNLGAQDQVVDLIEKVFNAEGNILSVEEAAQLVENKLAEVKNREIETLAKLSKFKNRLGKLAEIPVEASIAQPSQSKTLSNTGSVPRPLNARERAIMAFENAKNKV